MKKDYIQETISKQIDKDYFIQYYHSNCYGDTITTFTLYKGDICVPEYSKEVLHTINGEKRYTEKEVVEYGKEVIENMNTLNDITKKY